MARAMIVSAGAAANEYLSARLGELGYLRPVIVPSGTEARRRMLAESFELILVNAPLPDEFGHELCADAAGQTDAGVMLLAKAAAVEQLLAPLNGEGVLVVPKPFSAALFLQAVHMAAASNHRLQRLRAENDRPPAAAGPRWPRMCWTPLTRTPWMVYNRSCMILDGRRAGVTARLLYVL